MKNAFKSDTYRKNRGGHSRWFLLSCEKCGNSIATYQKDGPGILKRLYLDRIINLKNTEEKELVCKKCKTVLGVLIVYKKENRPAYRLFAGAVAKKIIKSQN
jgi:hypothetical protein